MKAWKILTATLVASAAVAAAAWAAEGQNNFTPMSDPPAVCVAKCQAQFDVCKVQGGGGTYCNKGDLNCCQSSLNSCLYHCK